VERRLGVGEAFEHPAHGGFQGRKLQDALARAERVRRNPNLQRTRSLTGERDAVGQRDREHRKQGSADAFEPDVPFGSRVRAGIHCRRFTQAAAGGRTVAREIARRLDLRATSRKLTEIRRKLFRLARGLLPFVLLAVAAWVLYREFHTLRWGDVARAISDVPSRRVALASGAALLCYWVLSFYDFLALQHLGKRVLYGRLLLTAFVASAFGHNIGVSFLSAGSVRYRMYSSWGLSGVDVLRIIVFCALTFWVGFFATAGTIALFSSGWDSVPLAVPRSLLSAAGALCSALAAGYFYLSVRARPFKLGRFIVNAPRLPIALGQVSVGALEWLFMTLVLYLLLPQGSLSYVTLLALFLFSHMAGLISHVPGGLGVFEWVLVTGLDGTYPAPVVLGTVVLYRVIYYFGPFVLAVLLFGASELARRRLQIARLGRRLLQRAVTPGAGEPKSE